MSNSNNTPQCPICKKEIEFSARYGNYVCNECVDSGTFTEDGRRIRHGNVDYTGGFVSLIEGETEKGNEHYCYINHEVIIGLKFTQTKHGLEGLYIICVRTKIKI